VTESRLVAEKIAFGVRAAMSKPVRHVPNCCLEGISIWQAGDAGDPAHESSVAVLISAEKSCTLFEFDFRPSDQKPHYDNTSIDIPMGSRDTRRRFHRLDTTARWG